MPLKLFLMTLGVAAFLWPIASAYYYGCFTDTENRTLNGPRMRSSSMTLEMCKQFCSYRGYPFAGTQYYSQCFCGDEYDLGEKKLDTDCDTPCSGNEGEMCGGTWKNSIYWSGYAGCFEDPIDLRWSIGPYDMEGEATVDLCVSTCGLKGFLYAGTKDFSKCYCSNMFLKQTIRPYCQCMARCKGNKEQVCGGKEHTSVFRIPPQYIMMPK